MYIIQDPGRYKLLVNCTNAVAIGDDVDLNLNGHTISGPSPDNSACDAINSVGIIVNAQSNVHIHNGEVTGFRVGISFDTAHYNHVNDVAVTGNCDGINVKLSHNIHINDNNVSGNFHSGVTFGSSNDNTLVSNEVNNNGGGDGAGNPGVLLDNSSNGNVIAFNHISGTQISTMGSKNQGMRLIDSHKNFIFGNKVNGSAGEGIRIDGPFEGHVGSIGNVVLFNRASGNALDLADYNLLSPPPSPPCVNLNLWKFNRFVTDNEVPPFFGPGLGCIQ